MSTTNASMSGFPFIDGKLKTVLDVIPMAGAPLPATVTLTSTDAGRKIEVSTDGTNFFQPTYDATVTAFINVVLRGSVRSIRLSGAVNDPWSVL